MLEIIREYAYECFDAGPSDGAYEALCRCHAVYFASLADRGHQGLRSSAQRPWLVRFDADHDNFRAALGWSLDHNESTLLGELCIALWSFWRVCGYLHEGRRWLTVALSLGQGLLLAFRAAVLNGAGVVSI